MPITDWVEKGFVAGLISIGATLGTLKITSRFQEKTQEKSEKDLNKRIDNMESELCKADDKAEEHMGDIERRFEKCRDDRKGCQRSVGQPIWEYIMGDDKLPRFVPMITYKENHLALRAEVAALAKKIDDRDDKIFGVMDKILTAVSK